MVKCVIHLVRAAVAIRIKVNGLNHHPELFIATAT
jgi:hypothetical protein